MSTEKDTSTATEEAKEPVTELLSFDDDIATGADIQKSPLVADMSYFFPLQNDKDKSPLKVKLQYISPEDINTLYKRHTTFSYNKKVKAKEDKLDYEAFIKDVMLRGVKHFSGLTVGKMRTVVIMKRPESDNKLEYSFSQTLAYSLADKCADWTDWVLQNCVDPTNFHLGEIETELGN